jgi:hypothetical protein
MFLGGIHHYDKFWRSIFIAKSRINIINLNVLVNYNYET